MISVIVPVYKVEKYIDRCVCSILSQTYKDYELILVDDGSPDRCGSICDDYAMNNAHITVIHRENGGLSAARNTGLEWAITNSSSEWVTFIDSDDWVHPKYLELLLAACENSGVSISSCAFRRTTVETIETLVDEERTAVKDVELYWRENQVSATIAWGKLYRKKDWENIRYPEGKIHEDELTTYKLLFKYSKVAYIPIQLYYYYQNNQGIMAEQWSEKNLAGFEAAIQQRHFFYEKGYMVAANYAELRLVNRIWDDFKKSKASDRVNLKTKLKVWCLLRKTLFFYAINNNIAEKRSIQDFDERYIAAFPVSARIYLHAASAMKKLKRMVNSK